MVGLHEVFTVFFVTLGPLNVVGPFAAATHDYNQPQVRRIALHAFVIATLAITAGGVLGATLLHNWGVSVGAMTLAGGLIFLITALQQLLEQYQPRATVHAALPDGPVKAAIQLVFPVVVTPYGVAAVIALLASSGSWQRTAAVLGLAVVVMCLNLLVMLFARQLLGA